MWIELLRDFCECAFYIGAGVLCLGVAFAVVALICSFVSDVMFGRGR